ncbi:PD-(D/E)XK nuclease family protein [Candidatus Woesearchaeota archaeon]|nr:PD-(D/E)XK nuclease family protein [Candidatus Woesearchaeota archaeon]
MARRIQSPSSINTYKQCPRKYYYVYIKKLQTLPSIHLIRGSIAHSALEDFFKVDVDKLPETEISLLLKGLLKDFLLQKWNSAKDELEELDMTEAQRLFYYEETEQMLMFWIEGLMKKLSKDKDGFKIAFKKWIPRTEEEYISEQHQIKGFIDAIHEVEDEIIVMDYKTSKRDHITPEYKLQLAIYALLYQEKHGKLPTKAGINFLRHGERMIDVDEELLKLARFEIEQIHAATESDLKDDYPRKPSPLCKWHSGQCDFYDLCYDKSGKLKQE